MKKRIIVLDDEPLIAVLMKEVIEEDPRYEIAQITSDRRGFLDCVEKNSYDAALIDISVGSREGGIEILQLLKDKVAGMPFIVLSAHDELYYGLKCLQAGASAYISKRYICTDVIQCLDEVMARRLYVSGNKGQDILKQYRLLNSPVESRVL